MPRVSSKAVLCNLLLLITLKWTVVGAVVAIGMLSMNAEPAENSLHRNVE
jgi:hypothetical protein